MCKATVRSLLAANFQLFEEILSPQLLLLLLMMKIDHHFPPISFNHMFVSPPLPTKSKSRTSNFLLSYCRASVGQLDEILTLLLDAK